MRYVMNYSFLNSSKIFDWLSSSMKLYFYGEEKKGKKMNIQILRVAWINMAAPVSYRA